MFKTAAFLRLGFLVLLLLLSFLNIFRAPAYPFWLSAVLVNDYGWVLITVTLIILLAGIKLKRFKSLVIIVSCLSVGLFSWPMINAWQISRQFDAGFDAAFGLSLHQKHSSPYSFTKMFAQPVRWPYQSVVYKSYSSQVGKERLSLDFYRSPKNSLRPCVIVVHGGSWSSGNSQQLPELNGYLAAAGYQVASVNYRLAPTYHNPAPVKDVADAIRYLKQHALQLQIDTSQLVLLGRSAGGQIALVAAYDKTITGVVGVIDFYGPADMVWGYANPANPLVFDSKRIMEKYLGGTYSQMPENYKASSPIEYVNSRTVPTLLIHGKNDVLVAYEHSVKLNQKLTELHVSHYFLSLPWATHGFDYSINSPGGQLSTYAVMRFMAAVTH